MRPYSTSREGRRGTITVIVVAFLALLFVLALTFVFYSIGEADQAITQARLVPDTATEAMALAVKAQVSRVVGRSDYMDLLDQALVQGAIGSSAADVDWYSFSLSTPSDITLVATSPDGDANSSAPTLSLYNIDTGDPDNLLGYRRLVQATDDADDGTPATVRQSPSESGDIVL